MTIRRIDETGDIITRGRQFVSGLNTQEEVAQKIKMRLRMFTGEYFRDVNDGTPWFQVVLNKNSTISAKDAVIKRRIVQTDGVVEMVSFNSDYDITTRAYTISAEVLTNTGVMTIEFNESVV